MPVEGWDFSAVRGSRQRGSPALGLPAADLAADRRCHRRRSTSSTGGGEVLAGIAHAPPRLVATERVAAERRAGAARAAAPRRDGRRGRARVATPLRRRDVRPDRQPRIRSQRRFDEIAARADTGRHHPRAGGGQRRSVCELSEFLDGAATTERRPQQRAGRSAGRGRRPRCHRSPAREAADGVPRRSRPIDRPSCARRCGSFGARRSERYRAAAVAQRDSRDRARNGAFVAHPIAVPDQASAEATATCRISRRRGTSLSRAPGRAARPRLPGRLSRAAGQVVRAKRRRASSS